jgi:hypothetical protein
MSGSIVRAVTASIEADCDELWCAWVRGGCAHARHVATTGPDGYDGDAFLALARYGSSFRARLAHYERSDGTLAPSLIFLPGDFERRSGPRKGAQYRRDHLELIAAVDAEMAA